MDTSKSTSALAAAQSALADQQIQALRDWLGEDHELLANCRAALPAHAPLRMPMPGPSPQPEFKAAA